MLCILERIQQYLTLGLIFLHNISIKQLPDKIFHFAAVNPHWHSQVTRSDHSVLCRFPLIFSIAVSTDGGGRVRVGTSACTHNYSAHPSVIIHLPRCHCPEIGT